MKPRQNPQPEPQHSRSLRTTKTKTPAPPANRSRAIPPSSTFTSTGVTTTRSAKPTLAGKRDYSQDQLGYPTVGPQTSVRKAKKAEIIPGAGDERDTTGI